MINIIENFITVKNYLVKSNLPASDFVINPYTGCPHGCKYCYACFMKRFTGHSEKWGEFIDIKYSENPINIKKIKGKSVFLSSVTDCYNEYEKKYEITKNILLQLISAECELGISTKSDLILRDIDLLKQFKKLKVSMSINTLDENFKNDMDNASSIVDRLNALKKLHENGIYTVLFMSPIFPEITEWKKIIDTSKSYINEYWFENLNLRSEYKQVILSYISQKYPDFLYLYKKIYDDGDISYWVDLLNEIEVYCNKNNITYINYFYHKKLVEFKKSNRIK